MPASKKRPGSRKYNPNRWIERTINANEQRRDANPLTPSQQTDLGLCHHIAFENMLKRGSEEDWYVLASSMNVALVLAEQGYGTEYIPDVKAAMESIMDCKYRADRTKRWAFDGDGIQSMRRALDLHDQQCAMATRAEIKAALQAIVKRANEGFIVKRANEGFMYACEQCQLEAA
jgi:hypothetical protein